MPRMEAPKKPRGRPPKEPGQKQERRAVYLLPSQWAEMAALGGVEWLRTELDASARKRARKSRGEPPAG